MDEALKVREFWFGRSLMGPLPPASAVGPSPRAEALNRRMSLWFESDSPQLMEQRDEIIRAQFRELVERAARGELAGWADSPRRCLSLVILLDQFPRQIYRGTARAFAHDEQALTLALKGMQAAADGALNVVERIFFYMPLQHSESSEVQDESVAAYRRLLGEAPADLRSTFEGTLEYAEQHSALIRRFGRFPHRNRLLGRANTPEEESYLKDGSEGFGQ